MNKKRTPRSARLRRRNTTPGMKDVRNWKRALQDVLDAHNTGHALRAKVVAARTTEARAQGLFRIFSVLRELGFRFSPLNLADKHIQWLMRYWTADPAVADLVARERLALIPRKVPQSPAYIQLQLSFLRVYCRWIGKPGMVRPAIAYVADPGLVERKLMATSDRSWDAADVDPAQIVARVMDKDPHVGTQLAMMLAFGMRRKEAVMFCPEAAEVPRHALPIDADPTPYLAFLRIKRGTKGGRLRFTAIRNEAQRAALAHARDLVNHSHRHIGRPGLTLVQSLDLFTNTLRRAGVTRALLGITPHGLRHQFAADLYFELTEVAPPVRGDAPGLDRDTMNAAYLEVARQLGHGRPQISGAYLGSRVVIQGSRKKAPADAGGGDAAT